MRIFETKWTEKKLRVWAAQREIGRLHWVLTHGVMGWGTTMFLFMTAFALFIEGKDILSRRELITRMIIWPSAGVIFGLSVWSLTERSYRRHIGNRK